MATTWLERRRGLSASTGLRAGGLVAATALQVTGLAVWLGLVQSYPSGSMEALLGVAALAAGLFLGSLLTGLSARGRRRPSIARTLALGVSESVLWVGWLAVVGIVGGFAGIVAASVMLAVMLVPHRALEAGLFRGHASSFDVTAPFAAVSGGIEAAGAAAWLAYASHGPALLDLLGVGFPTWGDLVAVVGGTAAPAAVSAGGFGSVALVGLGVLAVLRLTGRVLVVRHAGRGGRRRRRDRHRPARRAGW